MLGVREKTILEDEMFLYQGEIQFALTKARRAKTSEERDSARRLYDNSLQRLCALGRYAEKLGYSVKRFFSGNDIAYKLIKNSQE